MRTPTSSFSSEKHVHELGRIHLQHTRIAVAFARCNLLLFFSSKTIKNSNGQMQRLYAYAANECALVFLDLHFVANFSGLHN